RRTGACRRKAGEGVGVSVRIRRHVPGRAFIASVLTVLALVGHPAIGHALPPPPPNPSDDALKNSQAHVSATATRVGQLANQVAQADAALLASQSQVELRHEQANKALINEQAAQAALAAATLRADSARAEADAAAEQIAVAHRDLDDFAAASFRQGSTVGSLSAFLGSKSPKDLLARAELLDAVGGAQLHAVDNMRRARVDAANKDSQTRAALAAAQAAKQISSGSSMTPRTLPRGYAGSGSATRNGERSGIGNRRPPRLLRPRRPQQRSAARRLLAVPGPWPSPPSR